MEPEGPLEDDFPLQPTGFQVPCGPRNQFVYLRTRRVLFRHFGHEIPRGHRAMKVIEATEALEANRTAERVEEWSGVGECHKKGRTGYKDHQKNAQTHILYISSSVLQLLIAFVILLIVNFWSFFSSSRCSGLVWSTRTNERTRTNVLPGPASATGVSQRRRVAWPVEIGRCKDLRLGTVWSG